MKKLFKKVSPTSFFILLSFLYSFAVRLRLLLYRVGILRSRKVDGVFVVSVGNLTVGGTGKTPVTIMLAKMADDMDKNAAVVSRGYGRRSNDPVQIVSNKTEILSSYPDASDEASLCAHELKGIPMICAPKRIDGIKAARDMFKADFVILDDAFSHLPAHRDVNLLLVDAMDIFGDGFMLPAGRMREPLKSAARADAVIITRANYATSNIIEIEKLINGVAGKEIPVFLCNIVTDSLIDPDGASRPSDFIKGKIVVLLSAIASPGQFEETVRGLGADVAMHYAFDDHHNFSEEEIKTITDKAGEETILLTTQKDFIKLPLVCKNRFHTVKIAAKIENKDIERFKNLFTKQKPKS